LAQNLAYNFAVNESSLTKLPCDVPLTGGDNVGITFGSTAPLKFGGQKRLKIGMI